MVGCKESILWILLISASITDLLWGKIYNLMTFTAIVAGIAWMYWYGGAATALQAGLAVLVAFGLFSPLYFLKALAAGDIKLLMAVGAWSDTAFVIRLGMVAIFMGAIVGAFVLWRKKGAKESAKSVWQHLRLTQNSERSLRMPFAPAFFCAFLFIKIWEMFP